VTPLSGNWRSLALELIERVATCTDRHEALGSLFSALGEHIRFDCASAISLEGAEFLAFDKPEICRRAWAANAARYLREGRAVLEAGSTLKGVVRDGDVIAARERSRMSFFDEYMHPLGAKSFVMMLVGGPAVVQILSFSRAGAAAFRDVEVDALRMLHPAVSVAARAFSGVPRSVAAGLPSSFTPRETELVEYLVRGLQNAEIASLMGTSKFTVRNQVQHIFRKLDVSTRAELVAFVLANGWSRGFHASQRRMNGQAE
jgi:DNA-binding NarL/FixJ family response regulator